MIRMSKIERIAISLVGRNKTSLLVHGSLTYPNSTQLHLVGSIPQWKRVRRGAAASNPKKELTDNTKKDPSG